MIDTMEIFKRAGKSKESVIQTDLDSIRSTLFGKFYEGIIAKWLEENEGYKHLQGKPCVYWSDTQPLNNPSDPFIVSLNKSLEQKRKNNIRTNSDGLFEKESRLYLWEAKHWAKWDEGKPIKKQVEDLLSNSPWLLAKKVKHNGQDKKLDGLLFSWWQRFERYELLQQDVSRRIKLPFKFYITSDIIDDCRMKKYGWFQKLINEQKENIDEFFKELLGEK